MARPVIRLEQIEPGMQIRLVENGDWHTVAYVGARFFHLETHVGNSGPYGPEWLYEVRW